MVHFRKTPIQNKIRNALLLEYRNGSFEEPVRISERALARKYNTTAITVHAVCEDLAQTEFFIHLPGKRGYFFNPEWKNKRTAKLFLGVILGSVLEKNSSGEGGMDGRNFQRFSAACNALRDNLGSVSFVTSHSRTLKESVEELASLPLSAFTWNAPKGKNLAIFEALVEKGVPVVGLSELFDTSIWTPPKSNALIRDYYMMGALRACHLMKHHCKAPLYLGDDIPGKTFSGFRAAMEVFGVPFAQEQRFEFTKELPKKIANFCKDFTPDSIIANGWISRYISEILEICPSFRELPFFVEGKVLQKGEYGLKKVVSTMSFERLFARTGETVAACLLSLAGNEFRQFENKLLTEEEYYASGLTAEELKKFRSKLTHIQNRKENKNE